MIRLIAGIQILRPLNLVLCLIAILIAAFLIGELYSPLLPYTILVVISFAGASNILNDILDVHIDKINRPERVLPSGKLRIKETLLLMGCLYTVGIMSSIYLHPLGRQIALITVLPLLVLYTPLFKRLPFIGNLVVGVILGLVFLFTEVAISGNADKMWTPFFLAAGLSTIRELCKDSEDMVGDSTANFDTFPRKYGLISTLWLLRTLSIGLCFFSLIPWMNGSYGIAYLTSLVLCVQIPLLYSVFMVLSKHSEFSNYSQVAKILKGVTMAGMMVILMSAF